MECLSETPPSRNGERGVGMGYIGQRDRKKGTRIGWLLTLFVSLSIGWTVISVIRVVLAMLDEINLENRCLDLGHDPVACLSIGDEALAADISAAWNGWYEGIIPLLLIIIAMNLYSIRKQRDAADGLAQAMEKGEMT